MIKKIKRCKHCNGFECKFGLDPKDELCDECYMKLDEIDEFTIILELNVKITQSSPSELIEYLNSFAAYTNDIEMYSLRFKLKEEKKEEN